MTLVLHARLLRWWHCLTHWHRGETARIDGRVVYLGCECGRCWLGASLQPFFLLGREMAEADRRAEGEAQS